MSSLLDRFNAPPTIMESLTASHKELFAFIPEDHDGVMITVIDDRGARVGFAYKVGGNWTVGAELEKKWKGRGVDGRIIVGHSFKRNR